MASPGRSAVESSASSWPSGESANAVAAAIRLPSRSRGRSPPFGGGGPSAASALSAAKAKSEVAMATSRVSPERASTSQSLPPLAAWEYAPVYEPGSFEAESRKTARD